MTNKVRSLFKLKTLIVLLIICLCTFLITKVDILHFDSLKVVVVNKSKVQIEEVRILYYYTTFDPNTGKQGIGEKVVYKILTKIKPNETELFFSDFKIGGEGGLGISLIDNNEKEHGKSLCGYIESAPIGKFIITIEDDGEVQVKDRSLFGRACY